MRGAFRGGGVPVALSRSSLLCRENDLLVAAKASRRVFDSVRFELDATKDDLPIVLKLGRGKVEHCGGVPFACRRENNLLVAAQPSRRMLDSVSVPSLRNEGRRPDRPEARWRQG